MSKKSVYIFNRKSKFDEENASGLIIQIKQKNILYCIQLTLPLRAHSYPEATYGRNNPTHVRGAINCPPTEKSQLLLKMMIIKSPYFVTFLIYPLSVPPRTLVDSTGAVQE